MGVTSLLFRWRAELGFGKNKRATLATVPVADGRCGTSLVPLILHDLLQPPDGMMAVELDDGRRVFAPVGSRSGNGPPVCYRAGGGTMMIVPAGVKVHLALGYTDMRKGMDGLAMLVQETLKKDPFCGHLFAFRGKTGADHQDPVLGWQRAVPVHQADRSGRIRVAAG